MVVIYLVGSGFLCSEKIYAEITQMEESLISF